jgi:EpsI family protein
VATVPPLSEPLIVSPRYSGFVWPIAAVVVAAAFLAAYYTTFLKLSDYWATNETYSFGFLVPVITAYLLWLRRDRLRQLTPSPSIIPGGIVLAAGLATLIVGRLSSINLLEELSIPVSLFGLVLLVFGWRLTQSMTFPLLYLLAMIPFWEFLTGRLHLPFQLYSAIMGVEALRLFGIPVLRDGVLIELPNITLEVAQLCSGVNNLVAVLCLGVPLAHFYVKGWLKRAFILSMAVLIALLSNGLRVATVCFFAYYGIRGANGDVHGPYALFRTLLISGIGFIALFWLVARFADRPKATTQSTPAVSQTSVPWVLHGTAWALAVTLLVGAVGYERLHAVARVPLSSHLVGFPNEMAGWQFDRVGTLFPPLTDNANFDQWTSRVYVTPAQEELELLLGYFERQEPGRELGGFELARVVPSEATAVTSRLGNIRVKDGIARVKGRPYHFTYWYLVDGRVATEGYEAKLWTTFNSITSGHSNGGMIVVGRALRENESIETSRSKIDGFVEAVIRASSTYFPRS